MKATYFEGNREKSRETIESETKHEKKKEMLFETKVKYEKTGDDGCLKKVREAYVVEAIDVKDAQERITKEVSCFASDIDTFEVTKAAKSNLAEVIPSDDGEGDPYYKVKAIFVTLDERTGKEKSSSCYYLVRAHSFARALGFFERFMRDTVSDVRVASISETGIEEVFAE